MHLPDNLNNQNLVNAVQGEVHPGAGWQDIDNLYRTRTMIGPLGVFLGVVLDAYVLGPTEIDDTAKRFMAVSQPPLRVDEREIFLDGVHGAKNERLNALDEWKRRYFNHQPTWAERSSAV